MIPNAHCKKHDETEPQDNTEFWTCPKCSKESMNKFTVRDKNGKTPLDVVLDKIEEGIK